MSWQWYEIGRSDGYSEGRHDAARPHVIVDHTAIYQSQVELDRALALIAAYRSVVAQHPDRARIEQSVRALAPRRYIWRRITGLFALTIKLAGWILALCLIGAALFR